jgi:hypothetical protein
MLLMGFGSKKSFEEPVTVSDLVYLAHFLKGSDGPSHDGSLLWSIENLFDGNWQRVPSVDDTFVMLQGQRFHFHQTLASTS